MQSAALHSNLHFFRSKQRFAWFFDLLPKEDIVKLQDFHHTDYFRLGYVLCFALLMVNGCKFIDNLRGCFGKNEKSFSENEKDSLKNQLKVRSHRT